MGSALHGAVATSRTPWLATVLQMRFTRQGSSLLLGAVLCVMVAWARPRRPGRSEMAFRVLSASRCGGVAGMAISSWNSSLRMVGRTKVVWDIDFTLDRPASTLTKLMVNQTRCRETVTQSTCVQGDGFVIKSGVCAMLAMRLMPWSELVGSMHPPLTCPMKKGPYSGRSISIDMRVAKLSIRPDEDVGTITIGRGIIYDQDSAPYMCFEVMADLIRIKSSNHAV